jgi:hypothetical protein
MPAAWVTPSHAAPPASGKSLFSQHYLINRLPITQRLSATDRLIDQIVYVLYGLTMEEIAVVEGK